jgi:exopolysaccharide production protein ExoZ
MLNTKIISIQVLRAIACLLVVQVHFFLHIPIINRDLCGAIGVDIFFIISGFIISASIDFLPKDEPVTTFFINRFSRVVPYYYFLTAIFIGFSYLLNTAFDTHQVIKSLLFIPQVKDPVLFLGWSLNHEVFFYAFVGISGMII